ncbi:MAG: tetratricopeptide repeat protein [Gemmatimonadota bacterium]|nr:tetratricopeptide repeat protein [Gemmatimonadota bacterium]
MAKKKLKAKSDPAAPAKVAPEAPDLGERFIEWIQKHRRQVIVGVGSVVVIGAIVLFVFAYQRNREAAAAEALDRARFASQSGNFALAASDLSRLISGFKGTRAAGEGAILLGQVRLLQEQPSLAAEELRRAVDGGLEDQFRASAYSLLAAALENLGNMEEAGDAYLDAANSTWYGLLSAQYLNDAGRAFWAAGDTARAIAAYDRVVTEHGEAPSAAEARVRLGELRARQAAPSS